MRERDGVAVPRAANAAKRATIRCRFALAIGAASALVGAWLLDLNLLGIRAHGIPGVNVDQALGQTMLPAGTVAAVLDHPDFATRPEVTAAGQLSDADLAESDLPLDKEGRSALDGRRIPGLLARREMPAELRAEYDELKARRAAIAAGVPESVGLVAVKDLPGAQYAPARLDSGSADPERRAVSLALPELPAGEAQALP